MIYFDNAASAIPHPLAVEAAKNAMGVFANPSSPHFAGLEAREIVSEARKNVASALLCTSAEIYFTSSGTEANNIAILSGAVKNRRAGNVVLTAKAEHPSVLETVRSLEQKGFAVVYVPAAGGELDCEFLENALKTEKVCLAAFMQVNNQNGALTDLKRIRQIITDSSSGALFHSDITQGFLKVPDYMDGYAARYCDTASLSAHKIGGLKGVGALFIREGLKLPPIMFGGGQENGLRSGTENVAGIAAFGEAARLGSAKGDGSCRMKIARLRELFVERANAVLGENIDYRVPERHIDSLISISLKNVRSEVAMNYLSSEKICVSSSSACSTKVKGNAALESFGYGREYISSSLRIGFSPLNTEDEVESLVMELKNVLRYQTKGNKTK